MSLFGKLKRKVKHRVVQGLYGTTKGERYNKRRLKQAHEAWKYYQGSLSFREFMSEFMKSGRVLRNKEAVKHKARRMSVKMRAGKNITPKKLLKILTKLDVRRTPKSESHFAENINKHIPGGAREHGTFIFAGTEHTPDFWVNKDTVIEYKIIYSNTELHTAIGQALVYRFKYKNVFLVLYDARMGYDAVDIKSKEEKFLLNHDIYIIKYPQ